MDRVSLLEQRVSNLERRYAALLSHGPPLECTVQDTEDDEGTVLVTKGKQELSVNRVQEFVDAFTQSPLKSLTQSGVVYMNLWPFPDAHRESCDMDIPLELKKHTTSIKLSLEEQGFTSRFTTLSKISKTTPLFNSYYRIDHSGASNVRLHTYTDHVDGSTVLNSKQHHVLAVWRASTARD